MLEINSNQNKVFKHIKSLLNKKYRLKYSQFIIEGERFVDLAVEHCYKVEYICLSNDFLESNLDSNKLEQYESISKVLVFPKQLFDELTDTENTQGIISVLSLPEISTIDEILKRDKLPQILFLDRLQDPGNVGTIIRTADASGIEYILMNKGCVDPYNGKVVRSTAGSILNVKIIEVNDTLATLNLLVEKGYTLLVTALKARYRYDDSSAYGLANCLVIGNEANGVSEDVMGLDCNTITIPIMGKAESLNASVAAGIMMYKVNEYCIQNK